MHIDKGMAAKNMEIGSCRRESRVAIRFFSGQPSTVNLESSVYGFVAVLLFSQGHFKLLCHLDKSINR